VIYFKKRGMKKRSKEKLTRKFLVGLGIPMVFVPGLILAAVLGWDWEIDLGRLCKSGGYKESQVLFPKEAMVEEVLDGDTFELEGGRTVRMVGIDAPNRGEEGWEEVTEYLKDLIEQEPVRLEYDVYQDDKFGRILAYVFEKCETQLGCQNGERMVNWVLVRKGKARVVVYEDRRKLIYQDELYGAEKKAMEEKLGVWGD